MNEGGSNQPMPLVHNGIMYLTHTLNMVQALDAATGDLIWENQVGPNAAVGSFASMRNIAIYDDKIFLSTTDAKLYALDARTGAVVWNVTVADNTKGYYQTSGPLVVRGKVIQGLQGCDRFRANERCFISAYDAEHRQAAVEVPHRRADRRAGRRHLGRVARRHARRRRHLDRRQLRSRSRSHLLRRRAAEAVDAGEPRHQGQRRGALHRFDGGAAGPRTARSRGTTSTFPARRSTRTRCSSAC